MFKKGDIVYRRYSKEQTAYTVKNYTLNNKVRAISHEDNKTYCFMEENLSLNKSYNREIFKNYYLNNV